MSDFNRRVRRKLSSIGTKIYNLKHLPGYLWHHKISFGITNTKYDISFCVYRESFVKDQYDIKRFLNTTKHAENLFFLDVGRNHGFVFYYTMYHIMKSNFPVSTINYIGIDPSPLKFVYFNFLNYLLKNKIDINYFLIDKAVVLDDSSHVKLKYGEKNFGNFNIDGSNYEKKLKKIQSKLSFVEITVETISLQEIMSLIASHEDDDSIIVKIDCKNQTEVIFFEALSLLSSRTKPYLVACERDGSSGKDVSELSKDGENVLCRSNVF